MNIDWVDLLFRFEGRINRAKYWLAVAIWLAVWLVVWSLAYAANFAMPVVIVAVVVLLPSLWSGVAVGIKRLHDREMSGWWLLLFYLAPIVLDAAARPLGAFGFVLSLASFAISVWALVVLGFLRGTIGANAYGPDPVAPKPAVH